MFIFNKYLLRIIQINIYLIFFSVDSFIILYFISSHVTALHNYSNITRRIRLIDNHLALAFHA